MKELNIHTDYVLYSLVWQLRSELHIICSFMQETTDYGPEYVAAFEQYKKLLAQINIFEDLLAACMEHKKALK